MQWTDAIVYLIVAIACWRVFVYVKPQWQKLFGKTTSSHCDSCGGCGKK